MGIEGYNLLVYTNDLETVATSALKMVSLELDIDIDITILKSLIKLCRDYVGCSVCHYYLQKENTLIWPNCFFCLCI